MALQTSDPTVAPSPQVVANAFVEQYYHILHFSPEVVYRFYKDSSVLSRPEENGNMTSVTTLENINAKILSLDYESYKAEIKTADAQESYKDGVTVLVTGCLTGKDNMRRKFAQSFFLAPQAKGYYVLNDVFRYVDESEPLDASAVTFKKADDSGVAQAAVSTETSHISDALAPDMAAPMVNNEIPVEEQDPSQAFGMERDVAPEEEVPPISQAEHHISSVALSSQMSAKEDDVKNSYASIVKKAKDSTGPTKVDIPINAARPAASTKHQKQPSGLAASSSVSQSAVEKNNKVNEKINAEQEGFSIHVRNLPMNVMDTQLEQEFKRFGAIKSDGVQVRSNKQRGSCYGFVEFLSASSMESAIQASPITINGQKAFVEIKRPITQVDSGRGGNFPGRGGFHSDSFRGRGRGFSGNEFGGRGFNRNEFGGRGFNRNEFGDRSEYYGRGRGQGRRGGEGYQRGRGRGGRGVIQSSAGS